MASRLPLKEGSLNIPGPPAPAGPFKSPMLRLVSVASKKQLPARSPQKQDLRRGPSLLETKPLVPGVWTATRRAPAKKTEDDQSDRREWQRQWKIIMSDSHIFFDGIDDASIEKVKSSLNKIGTSIETFFGTQVSHVVTRRPVDAEYPATDLISKAKALDIKIWSYDKLIRFLTNLLGHTPRPSMPYGQNLSRMLREEKLVGPNDRDPRAKRDDYHYFLGPYLLVWDPTYHYRPFMIKEYSKPEDGAEGDWPRLRNSTFGRSPFVDSRRGDDRVALGKRQKDDHDEEEKRKVYVREGAEHAEPIAEPVAPIVPVPAPVIVNNRFQEIVASGVNMSNMTSAVQSVARSNAGHGGNGLNPVLAQVPSREVNKLKKQVFAKERVVEKGSEPKAAPEDNKSEQPQEVKKEKSSKDSRAGFCENCHEEFDNFEAHIESKKHRRYASELKHFATLDEFLARLQRKPKDLWNE